MKHPAIISLVLLLVGAVTAIPVDQEGLLLSGHQQPVEGQEIISTEGIETDDINVRAKKSYKGYRDDTICYQIERGPYGNSVTVCRDAPSSQYQDHAASYVSGNPHAIGYDGHYGAGSGIGLAGGYGSGSGIGLAGGYGSGSYPSVPQYPHSSPYGSLNFGPLVPPAPFVPAGLHESYAIPHGAYVAPHGGSNIAPHPAPHYRASEFELADSITRGIMKTLEGAGGSASARSAYDPYAAPAYPGRPANGQALGLFSHGTGGYAVPLLLSCQPNLVQGTLGSNQYHAPLQHYGPPAYRNVDDMNMNAEISPKKLDDSKKILDSSKTPGEMSKKQNDMARLDSLKKATEWDNKP